MAYTDIPNLFYIVFSEENDRASIYDNNLDCKWEGNLAHHGWSCIKHSDLITSSDRFLYNSLCNVISWPSLFPVRPLWTTNWSKSGSIQFRHLSRCQILPYAPPSFSFPDNGWNGSRSPNPLHWICLLSQDECPSQRIDPCLRPGFPWGSGGFRPFVSHGAFFHRDIVLASADVCPFYLICFYYSADE